MNRVHAFDRVFLRLARSLEKEEWIGLRAGRENDGLPPGNQGCLHVAEKPVRLTVMKEATGDRPEGDTIREGDVVYFQVELPESKVGYLKIDSNHTVVVAQDLKRAAPFVIHSDDVLPGALVLCGDNERDNSPIYAIRAALGDGYWHEREDRIVAEGGPLGLRLIRYHRL